MGGARGQVEGQVTQSALGQDPRTHIPTTVAGVQSIGGYQYSHRAMEDEYYYWASGASPTSRSVGAIFGIRPSVDGLYRDGTAREMHK